MFPLFIFLLFSLHCRNICPTLRVHLTDLEVWLGFDCCRWWSLLRGRSHPEILEVQNAADVVGVLRRVPPRDVARRLEAVAAVRARFFFSDNLSVPANAPTTLLASVCRYTPFLALSGQRRGCDNLRASCGVI